MCDIEDYNNTAVYNQNEKRNITFQDIIQKKDMFSTRRSTNTMKFRGKNAVYLPLSLTSRNREESGL